MNNDEKYTMHLGVYGVGSLQNKLLCIKKNAGPYQNRYDLPGGSQELGEGLTETLAREVLEETGHRVQSYKNCRVYDSFVKSEPSHVVHHIFILYDIELYESSTSIPNFVIDGENDSSGIEWVSFENLNIYNSSPIILKFLQEVRKDKDVLEKTCFPYWEVKQESTIHSKF